MFLISAFDALEPVGQDEGTVWCGAGSRGAGREGAAGETPSPASLSGRLGPAPIHALLY